MPVEAMKKLYDDMSQYHDMGSIDDFLDGMAKPEARKKIYDDMSARHDMGSFEDFETGIGVRGKAPARLYETPSESRELATWEGPDVYFGALVRGFQANAAKAKEAEKEKAIGGVSFPEPTIPESTAPAGLPVLKTRPVLSDEAAKSVLDRLAKLRQQRMTPRAEGTTLPTGMLVAQPEEPPESLSQGLKRIFVHQPMEAVAGTQIDHEAIAHEIAQRMARTGGMDYDQAYAQVSANFKKQARKEGYLQGPDLGEIISVPIMLSIAAGLSYAPAQTLKMVGKFVALDELDNIAGSVAFHRDYVPLSGKEGLLKEFLAPEGSPGNIRDLAETIDFMVKAGVVAGGPKAWGKLTKDVQRFQAPHLRVYMSPREVRATVKKGQLTLEQEADLAKAIGMDSKGTDYQRAIKEGLVVEFPAQHITQVADKPWWGKVKHAVGIGPLEPPIKTTVTMKGQPQGIIGTNYDTYRQPFKAIPAPFETGKAIVRRASPDEAQAVSKGPIITPAPAPPRKKKLTAAPIKEPWQMTLAEVEEHPEVLMSVDLMRLQRHQARVKGLQLVNNPVAKDYLKKLEQAVKKRDPELAARMSDALDAYYAGDYVLATMASEETLQKLHMDERMERNYEQMRVDHQEYIRQALSEEKSVPAKVLADYPDLVPAKKKKKLTAAQIAAAGKKPKEPPAEPGELAPEPKKPAPPPKKPAPKPASPVTQSKYATLAEAVEATQQIHKQTKESLARKPEGAEPNPVQVDQFLTQTQTERGVVDDLIYHLKGKYRKEANKRAKLADQALATARKATADGDLQQAVVYTEQAVQHLHNISDAGTAQFGRDILDQRDRVKGPPRPKKAVPEKIDLTPRKSKPVVSGKKIEKLRDDARRLGAKLSPSWRREMNREVPEALADSPIELVKERFKGRTRTARYAQALIKLYEAQQEAPREPGPQERVTGKGTEKPPAARTLEPGTGGLLAGTSPYVPPSDADFVPRTGRESYRGKSRIQKGGKRKGAQGVGPLYVEDLPEGAAPTYLTSYVDSKDLIKRNFPEINQEEVKSLHDLSGGRIAGAMIGNLMRIAATTTSKGLEFGKEAIDTGGHEMGHFLVKALKNDPVVTKGLPLFTEQAWRELNQHDPYPGAEEMMVRALGPQFAEGFEPTTRTRRIMRWLEQFWSRVKEIFGRPLNRQDVLNIMERAIRTGRGSGRGEPGPVEYKINQKLRSDILDTGMKSFGHMKDDQVYLLRHLQNRLRKRGISDTEVRLYGDIAKQLGVDRATGKLWKEEAAKYLMPMKWSHSMGVKAGEVDFKKIKERVEAAKSESDLDALGDYLPPQVQYLIDSEPWADQTNYIDFAGHKKWLLQKLNEVDQPSQDTPVAHYQSLTAPGGVNYREWRVDVDFPVPPAHPAFATDKMIAWVRTDDLAVGPTARSFTGESIELRPPAKPPAEKIMRIQEVQGADLFGGARKEGQRVIDAAREVGQSKYDAETLGKKIKEEDLLESLLPDERAPRTLEDEMADTGLPYADPVEQMEYQHQLELYKKQRMKMRKSPQFRFLKSIEPQLNELLIRGIVQKAAREDYTHVRFPTGNTILKIEGKDLIEDAIETELVAIRTAEKALQRAQRIKKPQGQIAVASAKKLLSNRKKRLSDLRTGKSELNKLHGLYEKVLGPYFSKHMGGTERVTDKHGNTWLEAQIGPEKAGPILQYKPVPKEDPSARNEITSRGWMAPDGEITFNKDKIHYAILGDLIKQNKFEYAGTGDPSRQALNENWVHFTGTRDKLTGGRTLSIYLRDPAKLPLVQANVGRLAGSLFDNVSVTIAPSEGGSVYWEGPIRLFMARGIKQKPSEAWSRDNAQLPSPEGRYSGMPVPAAINGLVAKVRNRLSNRSDTVIGQAVRQIVWDHYRKKHGLIWRYKQLGRDLEKKLTAGQKEDMIFYRQGKGNIYHGKNDTYGDVVKRLPKEARDFVNKEIEEHISNLLNFYNNSIFTNNITPRKEVEEVYWTGVYAKSAEQTVKDIYRQLSTGSGKRFTTRNYMQFKKHYLTYWDTFTEAGLVPRYRNVFDLLRYQDEHMIRLMANQEAIGEIRKLERETGVRLTVTSNQGKAYQKAKDEGYKLFMDPFLRAYRVGKYTKGPREGQTRWATTTAGALVHPDAAPWFESMFAKDAYEPDNLFWRGYDAATDYVRYARVSISGFHLIPLSESAIGAAGIKTLSGPVLVYQWIKHGNKLLKNPNFMEEVLGAGLVVRDPRDVSRHRVERDIQSLVNILESKGGIAKGAGKALKGLTAIQFGFTRFMFDTYLPLLKVNVAYDYMQKVFGGLDKKGVKLSETERDDVMHQIMAVVNNQFGAQAWELIPTLNNPRVLKTLYRTIGYPDWTISALNQAAGIFEGGFKGKLARRYWAWYLLYFLMTQQAVSYLFTGFDEDKEGKIKWDPKKAHGTFANKDPSHKFDFQLPDVSINIAGHKFQLGRDEKGRHLYSHFGKQMLELTRYKQIEQYFAKSAPLIQLLLIQAFGGQPYEGGVFPVQADWVAGEFKPWKGARDWTHERMKARVAEAARSILPFSIQQMYKTSPILLGMLPISKGLSLTRAEEYIEDAAMHQDGKMLQNLKLVLLDNGYSDNSIKSRIGKIRSKILDDYFTAFKLGDQKKGKKQIAKLAPAMRFLKITGNTIVESAMRRPELTPEQKIKLIQRFK